MPLDKTVKSSSRPLLRPSGRRSVVHGDSLEALCKCDRPDAIVTSLPDANELGWAIVRYAPWFRQAATLCLEHVKDSGVCVFYQTDRRHAGHVLSKAAMLIETARATGSRMLWHKIVLRRRPGAADLYRPGYSHLLAFSRRMKAGQATPDVFEPDASLHRNGMHLNATRWVVQYTARHAGSDLLIDPFCGEGTVLALAEQYFDRVIGIDANRRCVTRSRRLRLR